MKKLLKNSVLIIFCLVALVYLTGFYFFCYYFMPKTEVNGIRLDFTKKSDIRQSYENFYKNYELNVEKRDGNIKIKAPDFSYTNELAKDQVVKQNPFYWPIYLLMSKEYTLETINDYDADKLENLIDTKIANNKELIEPEDAKIVFNEKKNKFEIEKEKIGNKVNKQKLKDEILKSFESGDKKLNLEDKDLYYKPLILSDDERLNNLCHQKNNLSSITITYNFKDRQEELKGESLVNLYSENSEGLLVPNIESVKDYIKYLSGKYDTFRTDRNFYATGIGSIVVKGGIYGWLTDIDASTDQLIKLLEKVEDASIEPVYKLTAVDRGLNDLGNSYVEIDLGRQHMWLYKEGELVIESEIVSGNPNQGNATPVGTGKIWSRETDRFLTGDGWKSHVNYWLPFNWSGCGIHDSSWRSEYGKDIYKRNGSHGCVNTPPKLMSTFYNNTFKGMPVVVYDSSKN